MAVMSRRWARAVNAALTAALVAVAVAFGLAAADRNAARWDCSRDGRATLEPDTIAALHEVATADASVDITAFGSQARDADAWLRDRSMTDFLALLDQASPVVSTRFVDFDRERAVALAYGVERYGTVVVESGGRRVDIAARDVFRTRGGAEERKLDFVGEGAVAGAIRRVLREAPYRVGVLVGHGERSVSEGLDGALLRLGALLSAQGIQAESLRLSSADAAPRVPESVDAVMVLGPVAPLTGPETDALDAYLDQGGAVAWFTEPGATRPRLLVDRGVSVGPGVVGDVVSYYPHADRPLLVHGRHVITEAAREAELSTVVAGATPVDAPEGTSLLQTSARGWVDDGGRRVVDGAVVSVSVAIEGPGRMVVVGDVDLLGDELMAEGPGNVLFVANTLRWLLGADDALTRVGRPVRAAPVAMGEGRAATIRGVLVGWPLAVLLLGVGVLVARSRRL